MKARRNVETRLVAVTLPKQDWKLLDRHVARCYHGRYSRFYRVILRENIRRRRELTAVLREHSQRRKVPQ